VSRTLHHVEVRQLELLLIPVRYVDASGWRLQMKGRPILVTHRVLLDIAHFRAWVDRDPIRQSSRCIRGRDEALAVLRDIELGLLRPLLLRSAPGQYREEQNRAKMAYTNMLVRHSVLRSATLRL